MPRLTTLTGLLLLLAATVPMVGCVTSSLHPSFGQLYRDINMAQLSAHPSREPTVRGQEIQSLIGRHDASYSGESGSGGGGGGPVGTSMKTAGVSPLH